EGLVVEGERVWGWGGGRVERGGKGGPGEGLSHDGRQDGQGDAAALKTTMQEFAGAFKPALERAGCPAESSSCLVACQPEEVTKQDRLPVGCGETFDLFVEDRLRLTPGQVGGLGVWLGEEGLVPLALLPGA